MTAVYCFLTAVYLFWVQVEQEALLPIPVATHKRADPRLALTIGVAGWIAQPKDFGELHCPSLPLPCITAGISALLCSATQDGALL